MSQAPFYHTAGAGAAPAAPGPAGGGASPSEDASAPEDMVTTEALNDDPASPTDAAAEPGEPGESAETVHPDTALAAERLGDLQRLQAEYVNYKRRVDRDRALTQERAVRDVLESLLPVLDDIQGARDHGDLTEGPFAAIADKLETTLGRFGFERYGAVGEAFDPEHHEALMHIEAELPEGSTTTTVVIVLQPGYRAGNRILRPARVAVADPD